MIFPPRSLSLLYWYYTEALPRLDGVSIQGGIEEALSTYSRYQVEKHIAKHRERYPNSNEYPDDYRITPRGPETVVITSEDRALYGKKGDGPAAWLAWKGKGSESQEKSFRRLSNILALVGARDRLSLHVLEEVSLYGDAWGGIGTESRWMAVAWLTAAGDEAIRTIDNVTAKEGWPERGHPRRKLESWLRVTAPPKVSGPPSASEKLRQAVRGKRKAMAMQARELGLRAAGTWEEAAREVRERGRAA